MKPVAFGTSALLGAIALALAQTGGALGQTEAVDSNGDGRGRRPVVVAIPDDQVRASVSTLGRSRINQLMTTRVLGGILLGTTQQVSCGDCFSAFGVAGSASGGFHGRTNVTDEIAILGGASANAFRERGADVKIAPIIALSVRYDPADLGPSRPFFEVGGLVSPGASVTYTRPYGLPPTAGSGRADTSATSGMGFVRAGWVARLSPRDEVAVAADLSRGIQRVNGTSEAAGFGNPFPATLRSGSDEVNIGRVGAQYTRLLTDTLEFNVTGGLAYAFDMRSGVEAAVASVGPLARPRLRDTAFFEGGGRLGFRVTERSVVDTFVVTAAGAQPVGTSVHGGVGWRYHF